MSASECEHAMTETVRGRCRFCGAPHAQVRADLTVRDELADERRTVPRRDAPPPDEFRSIDRLRLPAV